MVYYHFQLQRFFFCWPHCSACRILVPWSGEKARTTALGVLSLNHWTTKKVPGSGFFFFILEWTLQVSEGGAQAISEDKFEITLQHTFLIYWVSRVLLGRLVCLVIWTRWWEVLKSRGHWPCFSDEEPEVVWNVGMGPGVVSLGLAKEAG